MDEGIYNTELRLASFLIPKKSSIHNPKPKLCSCFGMSIPDE